MVGGIFLTKSFGNGVAAENWILNETEYPELIVLKHVNFG
jgi:hypothetical protein